MKLRKSGILMHISSLPSEFGIGDLGRAAYSFADFLADSCQTVWQVLPFNPSSPNCGNSPYFGVSAFAGNPLLISPDQLVEQGFISCEDLGRGPQFDSTRVDYPKVTEFKKRVIEIAYERFKERPDKGMYERFVKSNAHWLDDYTLFVSLKDCFSGAPWNQWPAEIRDRTQPALDDWTEKLADGIAREKFSQFLFFSQWTALKRYCNGKQIQILGDMPIYVSYDSSDVWTNPQYFKIGEDKKPAWVAGVPPDYFSESGQLWGNPVYSWKDFKETSYAWWVSRAKQNMKYFDMVRLDHFRGFIAYWEVAATEKTAMNGKWVEAPAGDFFHVLLRRLPSLSIIAEDLGTITPEVREIMNLYDFPGMKVLLFAFGDNLSTNPYLPHNHTENYVVYTGTHDNNTVKGWFQHDATEREKENLFAYFGREFDENTVVEQMVRTALMSVASTGIIPMQDFLELGAEARMNIPSLKDGNWEWRVSSEQLTADLSRKIANLTRVYGRI